ncbi:FmdB family zinc ribbon protein [Qaidamihabitans albus]|uniref:FmdB family zinc ribbon protein n=1 Tax=Qaidamihabitans albus TaxID=2795733 RepID=UPI0018F1B0CC|nr:FmdB family zinc ribbon protein [Qaidamihabitans albus]
MATYAYHCAWCGQFEIRRPMGEAANTEPCPVCGDCAARRFTAPALRRGSTTLTRAREDAERTAERPDVVTAPPPSGTRVSRDPRHARLPRP